jgi:hypothetical protein
MAYATQTSNARKAAEAREFFDWLRQLRRELREAPVCVTYETDDDGKVVRIDHPQRVGNATLVYEGRSEVICIDGETYTFYSRSDIATF